MFSGLLETFHRKPEEWISSESESEDDEEGEKEQNVPETQTDVLDHSTAGM